MTIKAKTLLKTYLYVMSMITLTAALFSGAYLVQVAFSYVAPLNFSYSLYPANRLEDMQKMQEVEGIEVKECEPEGEVYTIEGNRYCWDESRRKEGLINSATIFISMILLFLLHQFGIRKTKNIETPELIIKGYTFISLMIYSVTGVIAIPTAIYQSVNYIITKVGQYATQYAPAYSIGLVILTLPLWYIFFKKMVVLKD